MNDEPFRREEEAQGTLRRTSLALPALSGSGVRMGWGMFLGCWAAAAVISLALGRDANHDLLNYHYYIAYALLEGRGGVDQIAPGRHIFLTPGRHLPSFPMTLHPLSPSPPPPRAPLPGTPRLPPPSVS